jgi:predicted anti-sigma-YlaC factor YlaD
MRTSQLKNWLEKIASTQESEISCSDCFEIIDVYVDLELAGQAPEARLPMVKQHLDQCQVCREENDLVRELARQEADETDPPIDGPTVQPTG